MILAGNLWYLSFNPDFQFTNIRQYYDLLVDKTPNDCFLTHKAKVMSLYCNREGGT